MKWMSIVAVSILALLTACGASRPAGGETPGDAAVPSFLRVRGDQVVDASGNPVVLRGVAFGNQVWQGIPYPRNHHSEKDYQRVAAMGMNSVRFYLHYATLEADRTPGGYGEAGWQWLDDNIAWARKNGIYLVLNMHVPPGGYQSQGKGKDLWESREAQERLVDLWRAIAARYRDEPVIAGYDLLNEPVVPESRAEWHDLAARMIPEIRAVDPDHILFVERVNAVKGEWTEDEDRNLFLVDDPNVVYEFHFYKPIHFTHQSAPWGDSYAEDQRYPDPGKIGLEGFLSDRVTATCNSPKLPAGDSDWAYYEGAPFKVENPVIVVGKPVLVAANNSGTAYFDDLLLEQLDDAGKVVRTLLEVDLTTDKGWHFWEESGGRSGTAPGHEDDVSLMIAETTADASLGADIYRVKVEQGATYRLSGWMRGGQIPDGATCQIRLDLLSATVPVQARDKAFLAQELDAYTSWAKRHEVPLYLGEFGVITYGFRDDRGGLRWVEDMLDLIEARGLHFAYHDWHEDYFGIYAFNVYFSGITLPDPKNANTALIELFKRKLTGQAQ